MAKSLIMNRNSATTSCFSTHLTRPLRIIFKVLSCESSPGSLKGTVALGKPGPLLYKAVVSFNHVDEIFALTKAHSVREHTFSL
jgi:hypothetical protein